MSICPFQSALPRYSAITVCENEPVLGLLAAIRRKGVRRLPVTDARGMLVGIASLDGVLGVLADAIQGVVAAIAAGNQHERVFRT